jgi:hypothetical protein
MAHFLAPRLGAVPAERPVIAGRELPPGHRVRPDPSFASSPSTEPVLWIADRKGYDAALARELRRTFSEHGLWPVVLSTLHGDDERPWLAGELNPSGHSAPDRFDVGALLKEAWAGVVPVEEEEQEAFAPLEPFGRAFPGLAAPGLGGNEAPPLDQVAATLEGWLGLVPATRPADVLSTMGWTGPMNHFSDMGMFGAVLRSWEDRFGAYIVGVGFDTLTLAVQRPPHDHDAALAIAAEHFAMCPDNVYQGAGTIADYAETLVAQNAWQFWWD